MLKSLTCIATVLALAAPMAGAGEIKNPLTDTGSWIDLKDDVIGAVAPLDGAALFDFEAPYRAHDAAIVPIRISQSPDAADITSLTLVVDENPAPVVAEIEFGAAMMPLKFETRVRVDQYSNVRAIATTKDGVFMDGRFVKASGGCSAPATKDMAAALASIGQMRLKSFGTAPAMSGALREAQIMIRHPNYSGLQRNQVTQLFIQAHFINRLEVFQGDEKLFVLDGGISISENPVFRFQYRDNGAEAFRIRAEDTEGNVFEEILSKAAQT